MQKSFSSFVILLLLGVILLSWRQTSEDKYIIWSEYNSLVWKYFEGKPDERSPRNAMSFCGIGYKSKQIEQDSLSIVVKALFNKKEAWVKEKSKNSKYLLKHEQVHFDIVELHARRFRKNLSAIPLYVVMANSVIDSLYKASTTDYKAMQVLYDKETHHSEDRAMQLIWNKKIAVELAALSTYSDTLVIVRFNR